MAYGRDFRDELDDLRDDLSRLRQDALALFGSLINAGRQSPGTAGHRVFRGAEDWLEDVKATLGEARQRGQERLSELTERVGKKPLVGALMAIGVGLALAAILRRRDRWS
jgi:hypothetical protein